MERPARPPWAGAVVLVALVAALAPVWQPGTAHACTCDTFDPTRAFAAADAVFVGEALDVRTAPDGDPAALERRYLFRVTDLFKGDVFARQSVVSSTQDGRLRAAVGPGGSDRARLRVPRGR